MEKFGQLLFCSLLGFGLSFVVLFVILRVWQHRRILPRTTDFHHSHHPDYLPVPRLGGIALAAAFAAIFFVPLDVLFGCSLSPLRWVIAGTSLGMFGLGLWDDLCALGAKRKLAGQLILASTAYFLGLGVHLFKIPLTDHIIALGWLSWPVTVLWLVALTNLINLIDGADGLAGGICLMLMVLMTVVGGDSGCVPFVAALMAGALLAFLRFNFPPARIYLGDGGAYFLGFLIGCLTIHSSHKGTVLAALIAPLFVLALPLLDTSLAILRRGVHGLPLFRPDRRHLHHRLLESGLSRPALVLGAYTFTAFFLGLGLVVFWSRSQYFALLLGGATVAVLLLASRFSFSREWFALARVLGNSLGARAEIQYALAHTRWLVLESGRGGSISSLCEDTAFIARKLGFARLRIRLEDGERTWELAGPCASHTECSRQPLPQSGVSRITLGSGSCQCYAFRHTLPGHPACSIEFQTPDLGEGSEDGGRKSKAEISKAESRKMTMDHKTTDHGHNNGKAEIGKAESRNQPIKGQRSEARLSAFCPLRLAAPSKIAILSDVLAEAWAKALVASQRRTGNQWPVRFYQPPSASVKTPEEKAGEKTTGHGP